MNEDGWSFGSSMLAVTGVCIGAIAIYAAGSAKGRYGERRRCSMLIQQELEGYPKFFTAEAVASDPNAKHQAVVKKKLDDVIARIESPGRRIVYNAKQRMKLAGRNALKPLNNALI